MARTPFPVELEAPQERLGPAVEAAAYYVVSEALTNIAKYAQASSARVSVRQAPGGSVIVRSSTTASGGPIRRQERAFADCRTGSPHSTAR